MLTGTAAANTLNGVAGNDYLKGLGGKDTLNGATAPTCSTAAPATTSSTAAAGSTWSPIAGSAKVVFDLSCTTDTAKRGSETDTLTGIEGAIGSSAADVFKGNEFNNYFQGGQRQGHASPAAAAATSTTSTPWPRAGPAAPIAT